MAVNLSSFLLVETFRIYGVCSMFSHDNKYVEKCNVFLVNCKPFFFPR